MRADTPAAPALAARIARHREIEAELRALSDEELVRWLSGSSLSVGGHGTVCVPRVNADVFVKLVPLTALELRPEHRHSTANLFGLPTYYQHRLGGCGFGAWRELEVHRQANEWVLSGQCPDFVLLHDWRVLPMAIALEDDRTSTEIWGHQPVIKQRAAAVLEATSSVALFLEHFPMTLLQWTRERPIAELDRANAVAQTEAALLDLLAFVNGQGVLHMDAHFENILTDGSGLFLSDHGLAISPEFDLDAAELAFFDRHQNFDRCTAITSNVHSLVTRYDARKDWRKTVRELIDGTHAAIASVPAAVREYVARRGPVALAIGEFYRCLITDLTTEYPASRLEQLLDAVE